jgi:hypothetical protein
MAKLNANVVLVDKVTGQRVVLLAGDDAPKEYADLLGEHLFEEPRPKPRAKSAAKSDD